MSFHFGNHSKTKGQQCGIRGKKHHLRGQPTVWSIYVPGALLLLQLPVNDWEEQQNMFQVFGPRPPPWEIQMNPLAPGFSLPTPGHCGHLRSRPEDGRVSHKESMSSLTRVYIYNCKQQEHFMISK